MKRTNKVFVSCAWPYANGSLHIGHIAALLPSDILARFHHQIGDEVLFVSGTDCHGTPISVRAEREKVTPESLATKYHEEFVNNFTQLSFSFDLYGLYTQTQTPEHKRVVQEIFLTLYNSGFIGKRTENAMYDPEKNRFLPDRYIEGECPFCHFNPARGDQCDNCGRLLDPQQLINPISKLSKTTPIEKETEHFYFLLSNPQIQKELRKYISRITHLRKNTRAFVSNFLAGGLHDRAITRDLDWGIALPKELGDYPSKKIYVWFEAVCGYLSASKMWAKNSDSWEQFWLSEDVLAYYVYGKDNIPFHTIIWPAILIAYSIANGKTYHLPDKHVASEYVQIEGKKLSTSRNWAIWIPDLLKDFSPDAIRYALISLNPETSDTNFSFKEFQAKNNNELLATLGNFIQRTITLAVNANLSEINEDTIVPKQITTCFKEVESLLRIAQCKNALAKIIELARCGNKFLDDNEPWHTIKKDPQQARLDITHALRLSSQFATLLFPFLPEGSMRIKTLLSLDQQTENWRPYTGPIRPKKISEPLFTKIESALISTHEQKLRQKSASI